MLGTLVREEDIEGILDSAAVAEAEDLDGCLDSAMVAADIEDGGETAGSKFAEVRQAAAAGQEIAARAMTRRGKQLLKDFQVGDNAT